MCGTPPTGGLACNTGMCPDGESNQQPFGSQAGAQSTEPHHPGRERLLKAAREKKLVTRWFSDERGKGRMGEEVRGLSSTNR